MTSQHEIFLARAEEARGEAEAASLSNVRDRCLRAASAWQAMAVRARKTELLREKNSAEKAEAEC